MKKRVLMISPIPSHPQIAGNRARIHRLGQSIKKLGHDFYFAHVAREAGDLEAMRKCWGNDFFFSLPHIRRNPLPLRIKRKVRSLFDKESYLKFDLDSWYDPAVDDHLVRLHQQLKFDVVIVEYVFFSKALLCFPDSVLKVIDTHDVFTNRHKPFVESGNGYNYYSTTASQESKGLNRADVIIAIQDIEREFFRRLTTKKIITIGHVVKTYKPLPGKNVSDKILFIGSANQSNIDAIKFFIEDIFPRVKQCVPNATLLVAGKVCRALNVNTADVVALGEVDDLESTYNKADVVVNPIRMGTGLKIKNIEALGYSKPLVTTSVGAAGLEYGANSAFIVADTATDFTNTVIRLMQDPGLCNRMSRNGYAFAVDWNQQQMNTLKAIINEANSG